MVVLIVYAAKRLSPFLKPRSRSGSRGTIVRQELTAALASIVVTTKSVRSIQTFQVAVTDDSQILKTVIAVRKAHANNRVSGTDSKLL